MHYLQVTVRFLAGTYSGVEWPPAPARLVQAIVAGCKSTTAPGLSWVERQPAPLILATEEPAAIVRRDYVPLNATPGKESKAARDRIIRRGVRPVTYVWAVPAGDEQEAAALAESAAMVPALGAGQDMAHAAGELVDAGPESAGDAMLWIPREGIRTDVDAVLSTPAPGMMLELARRHAITTAGAAALKAAGHWSPQGGRSTSDGKGFASVAYRPSHLTPRAALVAYSLVRADGALASWPAGSAAIVAGMLRHALIDLAGNDAELGAFASGHSEDKARRASIAPVPSTGHDFADGRIRRAMVTARPEDAALLSRLLVRAPRAGLPLIDEATGEIVALAVRIDTPRAEPVIRQILGRASTWASVQPIILPTYDDRDPRKTRQLVLRTLQHAGIDTGLVERIEVSRRGYLPQSVDYRDTHIKDRESWRLPAVHVRLTFCRPMTGPIVLGQGRNAGVGSLAPCADHH